MPAPRFVMQNFEFIKGGLKERKFSLKTTRQIKKRSKHHDNPAESWKRQKKGHFKVNRYLKHEKFVSPTTGPIFMPESLKLVNTSEVQNESSSMLNEASNDINISSSITCDEDVEQNNFITFNNI